MLNLKKVPTNHRLPLLSEYGEKAKNLTAKEAYFFLAYQLPDTRRSVIVLFDLAQDLLNAELPEEPLKIQGTSIDVSFVDEEGSSVEPIPAGIYYNPESDNFHNASTGHGKGTPFYVKWVDRKAEFPQSNKPLPIKVVETEAELSPTPVGYSGTILKSTLEQLGKPIKFDPKARERSGY